MSLCKIEGQIYYFPSHKILEELYSSRITLEDLENSFGCEKLEVEGKVFYLLSGGYKISLQDLATHPYKFEDELIERLVKKSL